MSRIRSQLLTSHLFFNTRKIDRDFAVYQAMIRAIDIGVEQLHNAAQQQLDRETIIIFGSDNGAQPRTQSQAQGSYC